jgi:membrane complex biogenesis BtpA family protein
MQCLSPNAYAKTKSLSWVSAPAAPCQAYGSGGSLVKHKIGSCSAIGQQQRQPEVFLTHGEHISKFRVMHSSATKKRVIGMLHLAPLPGSPRYVGDLNGIRKRLLLDAETLVTGGVHALMIENFGDVPFYPGRVPTHVATHMTALAVLIKQRFPVPLGINVLRNDGRTALAVAHASGADFIRVNVLCGARVADQGLLQGIAHDLLRDRADLNAGNIRIFADVDVKHSTALSPRPIADEVDDTIERGLADALVVSGTGTGKPTELTKVHAVKIAARKTPVYIGSGITADTIASYLESADGFIVGTAFKEGGVANNPVDALRVSDLMARIR